MSMAQCLAAGVIVVLLLGMAGDISAADHPPFELKPPRQPQYPLKTARTLINDEQIQRARQAVAADQRATDLLNNFVTSSAFWINRTDADVLRLIPPASVPRAFNVGTAGCPACGKKIYERGTYPWIVDHENPYYVKCPIDGTTYPSNEFGKNLDRGFTDQEREQPYFDDGWGWIGPPNDHRYWFVAYACHWHWYRKVVPGLRDLSRAYILTGDERYAHTAALMLVAIADRYPSFDYSRQSRFGLLRGGNYHGKIVNYIWETQMLAMMAEAYDNIWETIDGDLALQELVGKSGEQIRAHIEANIIEEGIDEVFAGKIQGNFGMHQRALALAVVARQHGPTDQWLSLITSATGQDMPREGFQYALYNYVYRDGLCFETAPGYCNLWTNEIYPVTELLAAGNINLYDRMPKLRDMVVGPQKMIVLGGATPAVGDSGSVMCGVVVPTSFAYRAAYNRYPDEPLIARWVHKNHLLDQYTDYESLLQPKPQDVSAPAETPLPRTRLMDGYGMAFLEDEARNAGMSLYYGYRGGHGHRDTLHFDIYARHGDKVRPMMPDTGYPDFMNAYVPGIFSWSKNTVVHNTVMVDRTQQQRNGPGYVRRFVTAEGFAVVDIDAADRAYAQTSVYRRAMAMIEAGGTTYFIDIFHAVGGGEHHYSLHGPPGEVTMDGQWTEPLWPTLAGEGVEVGDLYDAPDLRDPDYKGGFGHYRGSGFSHFQNPCRLQSGDLAVHFRHRDDPNAQLSLRVLPQSPQDQIIAADAQISPVKQKDLLRYILVQRQGEALSSTFVAVIEPHAGSPVITGAQRHAIDGGVVVRVVRGAEHDVLLYRLEGDQPLRWNDIQTDGDAAMISFDADGAAIKAVFTGGSSLNVAGHAIAQSGNAELGARGKVVSISPRQRQAVVAFDDEIDPKLLVGRYVSFTHEGKPVLHPVAAAELTPQGIQLTFEDALLIGRGRIDVVEGKVVKTPTVMTLFPPVYEQSRLTNDGFSFFVPVQSVARGEVILTDAAPSGQLEPEQDFWLVSFGPAAVASLEATTHWQSANP